ncbi:Nucleolar complex protein 2-like protein [Diplonema papillatum]|nr:Nucleolar complex protein 2-like protein [Diplonema papillatum]
MARSNVKKVKSRVKFEKSGGLHREQHFRRKVKPVKHKMMDEEKRRQENEEQTVANEERQHMEDVRRLKEIDPEFKEYLDKEDPGLGDVAENELDDVLGEDGEVPAEEDDEEVDNEIRLDQVEGWFASMAAGNLKGLRRCVNAFRVAAGQGFLAVGEASEAKLTIKSTEVFDIIVTEGVLNIPAALNAHLQRKAGGRAPHKCEKWDAVRSFAKSYAMSLSTLLMSQGLPDAVTAHVLRSISGGVNKEAKAGSFIEYLYTLTGPARSLLKACLHHVAGANEKVQLMAFLAVREMAVPGKMPPPFTDVCMKGMYLTFVKNTKSFGHETCDSVSYVMNECIELFGVDLASAYQHVFVYTRQLAVYLRTALQSGAGEEAFRHVYNWQYVNSLRLWALTVARYSDEKELFPLVYPIAQIATGVVELFPAPKTFPLHLTVLAIINHLARSAKVYIPVAPYLLRILSSPEFQKKPKTGEGKPVDLMFMLRAKKADLSNTSYHQSVYQEAVFLLTEHLAQHSHTIGFPEFVYPILARLKKLAKEVAHVKCSQVLQALNQRIKNNAHFISTKRKAVNFGPTAAEKVAAFEASLKEEGTPLAKAYAKDRERRDETRKMRLQALKGGSRKTVEEYADDGDDSDSEEALADLAQAQDVDEGSDEEMEEDDGEDEESDEMASGEEE